MYRKSFDLSMHKSECSGIKFLRIFQQGGDIILVVYANVFHYIIVTLFTNVFLQFNDHKLVIFFTSKRCHKCATKITKNYILLYDQNYILLYDQNANKNGR